MIKPLLRSRALLFGLSLLGGLAGCKGSNSADRSSFPFLAAAQTHESAKSESSMKRIDLPKQRVRASEFPKEFAWVNTDRPLYIKDQLKGNVVILDFWTYCCINCMHVLPDLEYIEEKYAGRPVVIIGVHSAKFDNEGDRANIETACERYNIAHPVIVDEKHRIWSDYGVRAWPTLMIIDPEGKVVGSLSGEGNREALDAAVFSLLEEGKEKGTLASAPPVFERSGRVPSASGLAFPGKVLAESSGKYLFISDSNHNRVIIADSSGTVLTIAGSGKQGQSDGDFSRAEFHNPQGLAYDAAKEILYVADTDNHLIRRLDLKQKKVETISGTGEQVWDRAGGKTGTRQGLNSPWDLALNGETLYIAMAGSHQIWTMNLRTSVAEAWAGSGGEDIQDGLGKLASLAQPSGLAIKGDWLYFADSEVSAVRRANLKSREVETLIGHGLFDFGDRIGPIDRALLQHPLGVTISGDDILVADTYNHKVKQINETTHDIAELAGTGRTTADSANPQALSLYEPGGISARGDLLYIADTNHDRLIEYTISSGNWREVRLRGLQIAAAKHMDMSDVAVQVVPVKPGKDLVLQLTAEFPKGIHLNADAPINYTFSQPEHDQNSALEGLLKAGTNPVEVSIPADKIEPGKEYETTLSLAYCTDSQNSLCVPVTLAWRIKLTPSFNAQDKIELSAKVKPL
jgi:thiol-disulfide isomerase/thioredoxin